MAVQLTNGGILIPCVKDCPGRKAGCHAACVAYKEYEAARNEMYERRIAESRALDYTERMERDWFKNMLGKYAKRRAR